MNIDKSKTFEAWILGTSSHERKKQQNHHYQLGCTCTFWSTSSKICYTHLVKLLMKCLSESGFWTELLLACKALIASSSGEVLSCHEDQSPRSKAKASQIQTLTGASFGIFADNGVQKNLHVVSWLWFRIWLGTNQCKDHCSSFYNKAWPQKQKAWGRILTMQVLFFFVNL